MAKAIQNRTTHQIVKKKQASYAIGFKNNDFGPKHQRTQKLKYPKRTFHMLYLSRKKRIIKIGPPEVWALGGGSLRVDTILCLYMYLRNIYLCDLLRCRVVFTGRAGWTCR